MSEDDSGTLTVELEMPEDPHKDYAGMLETTEGLVGEDAVEDIISSSLEDQLPGLIDQLYERREEVARQQQQG
jgi:hypothetical protein